MHVTCVYLPNFIQIKQSRRSYDVISISQDGGHGVADLILVACLVTALVFHGWVITTSGFRNKRPPYLNFISGLQSDHIHHFGMLPVLIPQIIVDEWPFTVKLLAFTKNSRWRWPPPLICDTVLLWAFDWYRPRWPWMTLRLEWRNSPYFPLFFHLIR